MESSIGDLQKGTHKVLPSKEGGTGRKRGKGVTLQKWKRD